MIPKQTKWIKRDDLTQAQRDVIEQKRFGRAHPSNWPMRPMAEYRFYIEDGKGWRAGDCSGWGPVSSAL